MDIPDGDLVRLARDGDPAAFRLLVERHLPMARARAARLCPRPDDADDAVQDAFLQAFIALDRLRDPDRWELGGTFLRQGTGFDYSATAEDGHAILAAAVPEPAGFAFLAQDIEPDDYRGRTVTFRGELRTAGADGRSGLALRASSPGRSAPPRAAGPDPRDDPASHIAFAQGTGAWIQYEVTAQVPADANLVRFGVFLNGGGQVELRKPQLEPH
jgi:hypothetical protein